MTYTVKYTRTLTFEKLCQAYLQRLTACVEAALDDDCSSESLTQLAQMVLATTSKLERQAALLDPSSLFYKLHSQLVARRNAFDFTSTSPSASVSTFASASGTDDPAAARRPSLAAAHMPVSSGLHRAVSAALDRLGVDFRQEEPVLEGAFYIDIVISNPGVVGNSGGYGDNVIAVEVDGPSHFVDASMLPQSFSRKNPSNPPTLGGDGGGGGGGWVGGGEGLPVLVLNSATLLKRKLLEKEGYQVISIPYYEWNMAQSKTDYLRGKLRECNFPV